MNDSESGAKSLKERTVSGVLWSAVDRFSSQGIQFIFGVLIARILLPEDYGVVVALNIFLAVAQAFIDSGFGQALIRKNDRTQEDFDTVFLFNVAVSLFFAAAFFLAAPVIASFFDSPLLIPVTKIVSLTLVVNALGAVQGTILVIELDFRKKAVISMVTITAVGALGLWMAYRGFGVWALVAQSVAGPTVRTVLQWLAVRWIPRFRFSVKSFRSMFSFGSRILATGLIDTVWGNLYNLVIGKVFAPASLGLYNRAESFASFPSSNIYGLVQGVLFPSLCKLQNERERLRNCYRQFIRLSSYIVFPMMTGLAAVADPFIHLILKDQWSGAIPLMQILCFALISYPLNAINITFPNILGHSEMYLRQVIVNKGVELVVLLATVPFGLMAMCLGRVLCSCVCLVLNTSGTRKLVDYGLRKQLGDVGSMALHSLLMGVLTYLAVLFIPGGHAVKLVSGIAAGVLYYFFASKMFMRVEYDTLLEILKSRVGGKHNGEKRHD